MKDIKAVEQIASAQDLDGDSAIGEVKMLLIEFRRMVMKTIHSRETAILSNIAAKINRGFNFKYDATVTRSIDGLVLWIVNRRTDGCIAIACRSGEYWRLDLGPRKRNVDPWNRIGSIDDVMQLLAAN